MTAQPIADLETIDALDFDPPCETNWCGDNPRPAYYVTEVLEHLTHVDTNAVLGEHKLVCKPCFERITRQGRGRCACGEVVYARELWRVIALVRP